MVIAGIGELVVDWIATEKGDHPLSAGLFYRGLGGNCANMAIGVPARRRRPLDRQSRRRYT